MTGATNDPKDGAVDSKADVLADVCAELSMDEFDSARGILRSDYPFAAQTTTARRYTARESLWVFYRDGFIDRYFGTRLVNPGVLRALSVIFPADFPTHSTAKMTETHSAHWELCPTIDHVIPMSRGGNDDDANQVTTSLLRGSAKAHWTLDDLGWSLVPPGDHREWDGLSEWFVEYVPMHPHLLTNNYVARWYRATVEVRGEFGAE
ncbi:HNH endonuclease [Gordonia sp. CPCC 205515]|uniref:HNH endonuclease n=1 Tax=Gordonia sp. CPCC 205515 TaxID=3140791 RepID=UPI003AF38A72